MPVPSTTSLDMAAKIFVDVTNTYNQLNLRLFSRVGGPHSIS